MWLVLFAESNPADYASKLKRLPQNLQESVESLSGDKVLHELIGDKLVTAAIAIRKVSIVSYLHVLLFFLVVRYFGFAHHSAIFVSCRPRSITMQRIQGHLTISSTGTRTKERNEGLRSFRRGKWFNLMTN
jgi:hypothetical protein